MFSCDEEDDSFNEEEFIKNHLSFLIESDEEFFENSDSGLINFLSYGEESYIYGTAIINSTVRESWSSTSAGSISSPKVTPTKFANMNFNGAPNNKLRTDSDVTEICRNLDFCFLEDVPKSHFINLNKSYIEEEKFAEIGTEIMESPLGKTLSEMSSNKIARTAPITELNMISKINENNVYEDTSIINGKSCSQSATFLTYKEDEDNNTSCEICLEEEKQKSLNLSDFLQKPISDTKSVSSLNSSITSNTENKENNFCKFCYKNGELPQVYTSHITKRADGVVVCPILRKYVCDLCGETGDNAHTRKYCHLNQSRFQRKPLYRRLSNGILTSSHNHK